MYSREDRAQPYGDNSLFPSCGFQGSDSGHQAYTASKGLIHWAISPAIHLYLCGTLEKVQIVNSVLLHLENGWKTAKSL